MYSYLLYSPIYMTFIGVIFLSNQLMGVTIVQYHSRIWWVEIVYICICLCCFVCFAMFCLLTGLLYCQTPVLIFPYTLGTLTETSRSTETVQFVNSFPFNKYHFYFSSKTICVACCSFFFFFFHVDHVQLCFDILIMHSVSIIYFRYCRQRHCNNFPFSIRYS